MKFVSFKDLWTMNDYLGILDEERKEIYKLNGFGLSREYTSMQDLIENFNQEDYDRIQEVLATEERRVRTFTTGNVKILPPLERTVHDIICAGFNYMDHLKEIKKDTTSKPLNSVYFTKRASVIIGPNDEIDGHLDIDEALDYEVELAVIIGKKGYKISAEEAEDYIFGYTIMNDISARGLQGKYRQWFIGKSLDTFTSMGPAIVYKDELKMPFNLEISSYLNGELRQSSNTDLMITNIKDMIAELSQGITLEPGDIISTGTCSGVGVGFKPPKYMKSKDVIECKIERIGTLRNVVK